MDFDVSWNGATQRVEVLTSSSDLEERVRCLGDANIIGFDTEWGAGGEVALVQLATEEHCLLCLLPEVCLQECPGFLELLRNPGVLKVGVAVALDADLLKAQFQVEMKGCVDLSRLAMREGEVQSSQPVGLAALTHLLLGFDLPKDGAVRRSNWAQRPLTSEQLNYAARDALAGRDCAIAMAKKHKALEVHVVDWCQDLVDKGKEAKAARIKKNNGDNNLAPDGSELPRLSKATLDCGAYSCVNKFALRPIFGRDGQQLLHMKDRTVEGLLRRGMASTHRETWFCLRLVFVFCFFLRFLGIIPQTVHCWGPRFYLKHVRPFSFAMSALSRSLCSQFFTFVSQLGS